MFWKIIKAILAVLFIPLAISSTKAFFLGLESLSVFNVNLFFITAGFFAYPVFHIVFFKPMYMYTMGHEITHVLATWLCGGKITSFHISSGGGSVTTTKTNLFITLGPYFVPFYTIMLFLLFWGLSRFYGATAFLNEFIFFIGFTMSFHIFMTVEVMKTRQPDLVNMGYLFSILFIYVANISIITLLLGIIFKDISFASFAKNTFVFTKGIYLGIFGSLFR